MRDEVIEFVYIKKMLKFGYQYEDINIIKIYNTIY
jgi:hypothetical protein